MKISLNGVSGRWHALIHQDLAKAAAVILTTAAALLAAAVTVAVAVAVALSIAVALAVEAQKLYAVVTQLHRQVLSIEELHVQGNMGRDATLD